MTIFDFFKKQKLHEVNFEKVLAGREHLLHTAFVVAGSKSQTAKVAAKKIGLDAGDIKSVYLRTDAPIVAYNTGTRSHKGQQDEGLYHNYRGESK